MASGFVDPVSRYGAQDEATYSRIALETAARGNWLEPTFLDRTAFFKPPLLCWLDGLSIKLFGISAFTLRLPSVISGAAVCWLAFVWVGRERGYLLALIPVVLIATDAYWIMLAGLNMMDAPLVALSLAGLFAIARDPLIARRRTLIAGSIVLGAALLLKSAAAIPPVAAVLFYSAVRRAPWRRIVMLVAGISIVAAPWYIYAITARFRWFWNEHILTELLGHNVAGTAFGSPAQNLSFYFDRLAMVDPVIAAAGMLALVGLWFRGATPARPVLIWLFLTTLVMTVFGYHAATYLLPVVTALALLAGFVLPRRAAAAMLLVVLAANPFLLARTGRIVWRGTNLAMAPALTSYCGLRRPNSLFLIETDDEFFSAAQPLPRVHYGLIGQGRAAARLAIDFQYLGIIVTAAEFDRQARDWPQFRSRLNALKLPATLDPRATEVLFPDTASIEQFIPRHPEIDFLVPGRLAAGPNDHVARPAGPGYTLLFGTVAPPAGSSPRRPSGWSCEV